MLIENDVRTAPHRSAPSTSRAERWCRQLADAMPDMAVSFFDHDLRLLLVAGPVVVDLCGDPEAIAGRLLLETTPEHALRIVKGPYLQALQGRESVVEFTDDARARHYRMRVHPVRDPDGTISGGMSVTEDITDEMARDAQARQIRQLTNLGSCFYTQRTGWHMEPELLALWGFPDGYDGHRFRHELIVAEDRDRVNADWDGIYAHGGQVTNRYRMHHGVTGELRHVEGTFEGVFDDKGVLVSAAATHVDVTGAVTAREAQARARAETAAARTAMLRQVSEALAATTADLEQVGQGIADLAAAVIGEGALLRIITADGEAVERDAVSHLDPAARARLAESLRRSEFSSRPAADIRRDVVDMGHLVSSMNQQDVAEHLRAVTDRVGEPVGHFIIAPVRGDGTMLGLLCVYRPEGADPYQEGDDDLVQVLADRVGAAIVAVRAAERAERERVERAAVTGRLEALDQEQRELLQQLARTESRERTLLAEAVHDDPLQLIVAAILRVDLVRMRLSDDEDEEMEAIATLLETSVERLRQLIIALAPVDLSEGLGPALKQLAEGVFIGTGVTIHVVGPQHVHLTPDRKATAYRIVREALVNARKHAQASVVTVRLVDGDGHVTLSVTDDGVGTASLDAGPGHLGLVTMRARAHAEGAVLDIASTPGEGTTVTVTLPANSPSTSSSTSPAPA